MSGSISTSAGVVNRVRSFGRQRFWASGGVVVIVDEDDGDFTYNAPMDMRYRARRMADEVLVMRQKGGHHPDELKAYLRAARELMEVVQEAEIQGDPMVPEVADRQAEMARAVWSSYRASCLPGSNTPTPPAVKPIETTKTERRLVY